MITYLIEKGIDLTIRNNKGQSAFLYACERCSVESFEFFIKKGFDVNENGNQGNL